MGKMKEYAQERGYLGCCDGINLCMDCQYHAETSHIYKKYRPSLKSWYNKSQKKAQKIRDYFNKKKKVEIPF